MGSAIKVEAVSKMQITFKDKARADEKAVHTQEYVSILRRSAIRQRTLADNWVLDVFLR